MRRTRLAQPILTVALAVVIPAGVVLQQRALADPARVTAQPAAEAVSLVTTGKPDGVPPIRQRGTGVRVHGTIATTSAPPRPVGAAAVHDAAR
jgi:hypothetical protein